MEAGASQKQGPGIHGNYQERARVLIQDNVGIILTLPCQASLHGSADYSRAQEEEPSRGRPPNGLAGAAQNISGSRV